MDNKDLRILVDPMTEQPLWVMVACMTVRGRNYDVFAVVADPIPVLFINRAPDTDNPDFDPYQQERWAATAYHHTSADMIAIVAMIGGHPATAMIFIRVDHYPAKWLERPSKTFTQRIDAQPLAMDQANAPKPDKPTTPNRAIPNGGSGFSSN